MRKKEKNLVEKKSNVIEMKQKDDTKEIYPNVHDTAVSESEEPQEYRISPVQVRRQLSSPKTVVTANVHEDSKVPPTHEKKHRIPPPIPIDEPPCEREVPEPNSVFLQLSVKKNVTLDTEGSPEPPPLPPRPIVSIPTTAPISPVTQFPVSPPPESTTGPVLPPLECTGGPVAPESTDV